MFDPSNYSQNILTAARALEQINNQLRSLENQARLLINSTKNVTALPASVAGQLKAHIDEINRLMAQAKGLTFEVEKTDQPVRNGLPPPVRGCRVLRPDDAGCDCALDQQL